MAYSLGLCAFLLQDTLKAMSSENEGVSRVASIDIYWTSVEALGSFLYVFCVVILYLT